MPGVSQCWLVIGYHVSILGSDWLMPTNACHAKMLLWYRGRCRWWGWYPDMPSWLSLQPSLLIKLLTSCHNLTLETQFPALWWHELGVECTLQWDILFLSWILFALCSTFQTHSEGNTKEMQQQAVSAQLSEAAFQEKSGFKSLLESKTCFWHKSSAC